MAINWKNRAKRFEKELLALSEKTAQLGLAYEQRKAGERQALTDLMESERNLARAVTTIRAAAEVAAGTATGALFRMAANDLSPRDTCAMGIAPKATPEDEQI